MPLSGPELGDSACLVPWRNESHVLLLVLYVACFVFVEDLVQAHLLDCHIPLIDNPLNFCDYTVDCSAAGSGLHDILLHPPHPLQVVVALVKVLWCVCNLYPCLAVGGSAAL